MIGPGVKYLDIIDARALAERATALRKDASRVPRIDYVSSAGDLSIVDQRFEFVISSHCIEHQPDLIRHLGEVERLLEPGGCYALAIPDRRFCFDHYLRDSAVEDVVQAFREQRKVHTFNSVVEHRALTTHNNVWRHWCGLHAMDKDVVNTARAAATEWVAAKGRYIDVHAWQFTPSSFKALAHSLARLGYLAMTLVRLYPTPLGRSEFFAVFEKPIQPG